MNALMERTRTQRLVDYLWQCQRLRFDNRRNNCGHFPARWADRELGTNWVQVMEETFGGPNLPGALRTIREPGGYLQILAPLIGVQPIWGGSWAAGDVAVFHQPDGTETLGVASARLVHAPGEHGLVSFDGARIFCHWSLECLKR